MRLLAGRRSGFWGVCVVILLGVALRFWGIGFGLPSANARPDETSVAGPALLMLVGDLRPPDFMYPSLFYYVLALLFLVYFWVSLPFGGPPSLAALVESRYTSVAPFFYISRCLSAVMGSLTVYWVYAIGRRVFDATTGILAAVFLAVSFLHVRDSHFGVTDVTMTGLIVLTVLVILRWQATGGARLAGLAGLLGGLATSTKYNALGVAVPFAVAAVQRSLDSRAPGGVGSRRLAFPLALFGVAFVVAFLAASPFILVEPDRFLRDVTSQGTRLVAGHGHVESIGWIHYAGLTLPAGMGWPIWIAGALGTVVLAVTRLRQTATLIAFPVAYFLVAGGGHTVFARHILPVVPFLAVTAAWLVVTAVRALVPEARHQLRASAIVVLAVLMAGPPLWKSVQLDRLLTRTDMRVIVARTLREMVPPGSTLYQSGESYGRVPLSLDGRDLDVRTCEYDEENERFTAVRAALPDWIVVQRSPLVLYSHVPDGVERVVREQYELVREFRSSEERPGRIYDQQDAFFLPLIGLDGIERPGPSFEVYRRKVVGRVGVEPTTP